MREFSRRVCQEEESTVTQGIKYISTRGGKEPVSAARAILRGIAEDGGLYVPTAYPRLASDWLSLAGAGYRPLAKYIMKEYLPDFSGEQLAHCIDRAYDEKFDAPQIAPLVKAAGVYFLELYHGPTLAFKDMALTVLPHLMKTAAQIEGQDKEIVILTATSGDTGKAALEGFAGVEGTKIIVFFPEHGVSHIQKHQMVTQVGDNTHVIGIEGNFDDAQSGVKQLFGDPALRQEMAQVSQEFSSANSINIGRLVPQIVYYFSAYLSLLSSGEIRAGEEINFVVPTGNFGNILAGYYARKMGLPVRKLVCASNENKVLYDFFTTGTYDRNRRFVVTMSPSMDILISSNLERLLFDLCDRDPEQVRYLMDGLQKEGRYSLTQAMQENLADFAGGYAGEEDTARAIKKVYQADGYLMDTHTAVAYSVYESYREKTSDFAKTVVVSTASPFKFTADVMRSLDEKYKGLDDFSLVKEMGRLLGFIPAPMRGLEEAPVRHTRVCRPGEMKSVVREILGL